MASLRSWHSLAASSSELNLKLTLPSGQAFRWRRSEEDEWTGTIGQQLFTLQRKSEDVLSFYCHTPCPSHIGSQDTSSACVALTDYFRLGTDLNGLYREWAQRDHHFKTHTAKFTGVRLLQQDPVETLIAFICSSNNNIPRISLMLERLCERYGHPVGCYRGHNYFSFPSLGSLAGDECEENLREMGFGYRAKYVHQAAKTIVEEFGGEDWLKRMGERPYDEAWVELQRLPGVGPKVADCVCLMGLGKLEAVPVDTHVWRVAQRDYKMRAGGSLTLKTYQEIGDLFRSLFGENAGWAQAVLFTAELSRPVKGASDARALEDGHPTTSPEDTSQTPPLRDGSQTQGGSKAVKKRRRSGLSEIANSEVKKQK